MCIIIYSNKLEIPEDILKNSFTNNPNGAGIMWKDEKTEKIHIVKGLMTFDDMKEAYKDVPKKSEHAVHCRIATSGKVSQAVCHPFPVRSSVRKMRRLHDLTGYGMMHNGIISFCTPAQGIRAKYSDSMEFAAEYLYKMKDTIDIPEVQKLIAHATNSRFCLMRQSKPTILIGTWIENEGLKFSNETYKKKEYKSYLGLYSGYNFGYNYGYTRSYKKEDGYTYLDDYEDEYLEPADKWRKKLDETSLFKDDIPDSLKGKEIEEAYLTININIEEIRERLEKMYQDAEQEHEVGEDEVLDECFDILRETIERVEEICKEDKIEITNILKDYNYLYAEISLKGEKEKLEGLEAECQTAETEAFLNLS